MDCNKMHYRILGVRKFSSTVRYLSELTVVDFRHFLIIPSKKHVLTMNAVVNMHLFQNAKQCSGGMSEAQVQQQWLFTILYR